MRKLLTWLRNPVWRGLLRGLACALLVWLVFVSMASFRGLEDWMLDSCFFYRGPRPTQAKVVLIGIDDATLAGLRKPLAFLSPELAAVVQYTHDQGASTIGIDLLIPDDLRDRPELKTPGAEGDARLMGQAVLDAGNVVLAGIADGDRLQLPVFPWPFKMSVDRDPLDRDAGFINLTPDDDQILRRQRLLSQAGPSFILALYARARDAGFTWDGPRRQLRVGDEVIPLDGEQELRINFVGPPGSFPVVSFREVLEGARQGRPWPELKGAVVLIGVTARGQQDYHATPFDNQYARFWPSRTGGLMAGTEVHAHLLATLQDRAFIRTPWWLAPLPLLLVVGAALGHALARLNLAWGLGLTLAHHFAWKALALAVFAWLHWRLEVVAMLVLGMAVYGVTFALRWWTLRQMLGVYKSEAIARALESNPSLLDAGGEERAITVLFADVRSFTVFSEKHKPPQVVALLNAYFDVVVPLIEAEGGVINQYMGDGVMVLFGAPAYFPDHAERALRAAVAMVKAVHEQQDRWRKLDVNGAWGEQGMRIGVGVNTGKVVVGAVGSRRRLDYTAIGDTTNATARIEAANKEAGTEILISAATHGEIPPRLAAELGCEAMARTITGKGKQESLQVYAVTVERKP